MIIHVNYLLSALGAPRKLAETTDGTDSQEEKFKKLATFHYQPDTCLVSRVSILFFLFRIPRLFYPVESLGAKVWSEFCF